MIERVIFSRTENPKFGTSFYDELSHPAEDIRGNIMSEVQQCKMEEQVNLLGLDCSPPEDNLAAVPDSFDFNADIEMIANDSSDSSEFIDLNDLIFESVNDELGILTNENVASNSQDSFLSSFDLRLNLKNNINQVHKESDLVDNQIQNLDSKKCSTGERNENKSVSSTIIIDKVDGNFQNTHVNSNGFSSLSSPIEVQSNVPISSHIPRDTRAPNSVSSLDYPAGLGSPVTLGPPLEIPPTAPVQLSSRIPMSTRPPGTAPPPTINSPVIKSSRTPGSVSDVPGIPIDAIPSGVPNDFQFDTPKMSPIIPESTDLLYPVTDAIDSYQSTRAPTSSIPSDVSNIVPQVPFTLVRPRGFLPSQTQPISTDPTPPTSMPPPVATEAQPHQPLPIDRRPSRTASSVSLEDYPSPSYETRTLPDCTTKSLSRQNTDSSDYFSAEVTSKNNRSSSGESGEGLVGITKPETNKGSTVYRTRRISHAQLLAFLDDSPLRTELRDLGALYLISACEDSNFYNISLSGNDNKIK